MLLGSVRDSLSRVLHTAPILLPILLGVEFWGPVMEGTAILFDMATQVVMEIGLITPSAGMNAYTINEVAKDIPMATIVRGMQAFLASDIIRTVLLVLFPGISPVVLRVLA